MAKKSQIIQYQQLSSKLSRTVEELISVLKQKITTQQQIFSDIKEKLKHLQNELEKLVSFYYNIKAKRNFHGSESIFDVLQAALKQDMEKPGNIKDELIQSVPTDVSSFGTQCRLKVQSRLYTPREFKNDVQDFLIQYSNDYKKKISMWENYKSLSKAYQNVCQTLYLNAVTLKDNVQESLNKKFTSKPEEDLPLLIPAVVAPLLNTSITIPKGHLGYFEKLWDIIKRIFGWNQESQSVEIVASINSENSSSFECLSSKAAGDSNCQKLQKIPVLEELSANNSVESDKEYRRWTTELDKSVQTIQDEIVNHIQRFFSDSDNSIIEKVCDQYYNVGMTILKEFDQRMDSDISEFIREIESAIVNFEKQQRILNCYESGLIQMNSMLNEFKKECSHGLHSV